MAGKTLLWALAGEGEEGIYKRLEELVEERWPAFHRHLQGLVKERAVYVNQLYSDREEREMVEKALKELHGKKNEKAKMDYLWALKTFMEAVGDKEAYDAADFEKFLGYLRELPALDAAMGAPRGELEYGNRRRFLIEVVKKFYSVNEWPLPIQALKRLEDQVAWSYNEGESYARIYKPEEVADMREKAMAFADKYPQTTAMFMLISDVGLRPIEMIHLLEKDVDLEAGLIVRKAAKRGNVTEPWRLAPMTIRALKNWLERKRKLGLKSPFIFVSPKTKKPFSHSRVVIRILQKFVEKKLQYDWRGCYAFRRLNMTLIAESIPPSMGAVKAVIKLMGWKTERTLLRYIKERPEEHLRELIFKALEAKK
ncbi:MAG: site-specific integrase [Nitrososphaerota archaeon]